MEEEIANSTSHSWGGNIALVTVGLGDATGKD